MKSLIYPPLFFYRRVVFVVLAFTITQYTYFQTQALVMIHLFYIMFIGQVYPNKSKSDQNIFLFNESVLMILFYFLFLFTRFGDQLKSTT